MTGAGVDGLEVNMAAAEGIGTCLWVPIHHVKTSTFGVDFNDGMSHLNHSIGKRKYRPEGCTIRRILPELLDWG